MTRATTVAELGALLDRFISNDGVARGLAFAPRPSDVIISPYAKSGTTWLQQIVHGLRTGGDMDFDDISRVVPWIETASDLGLDLEAEQKASPRAYKSHLAYTVIPKGCRYIVSLRDPRDAAVSFFRFMEGWLLEPGTVSIDDHTRSRFLDRSHGRDYWTHFTSWWQQREDPSLLLLAYEHMKNDLPGTVRRVARFLEIPADDALIELVAHQASLEFMLAHKDRFDDRLMRGLSETILGLPAGSDSSKVRTGEVGAHAYELSPEVTALLDQMWQETIETELGLPSYRAALDVLS